MDKAATPMSGRRAQAARNNEVILEAAREVFVADPGAPISAVAQRAHVGISALYRRYSSKEELLRQLCLDGLRRYMAAADAGVADEEDEWEILATFMRRVVEEDTHSLTLRLAGTFTPTDELIHEASRAQALNERLFGRARAAGVIRSDVEVDDLALIFEQLAAVRLGDAARTAQLRQRYLTLLLDALHLEDGSPLPGPPPTWQEIGERWTT
ncbi:MAG: TetR/AcrR family transcriptional regulator [Acidimicrobiales bacterium]